jgi:hypothetical protein
MKNLILCVLPLFLLVSCDHSGVDSLNAPDDLLNTGSKYVNAHPGGDYALSFDGASDYLVVEHDESLNMTDGFTITARIYIREYVEWASIIPGP